MPSSRTVSRSPSSGSRVQREYSVWSALRGGTLWARAEVTPLALLQEVSHGADGILDGGVEVHPVLVIEVDMVHAEALQGSIATGAHVVRAAVHAQERAIRFTLVAELGSDDEPVPLALDGPPHQLLVGEGAVHVRRIQEIDAELQGTVDGGEGFLVPFPALVEIGHA